MMNVKAKMMKIREAYSPTGVKIIGTVEKVEGVAFADIVYEDGKLVVNYLGETDTDWNSQVTVMADDPDWGRLFVDENGTRWCESSIECATDTWPPKGK